MATHASHSTTDHNEIRKWVENHGGHPASVKGTERGGEDAGLLRIDFPGYSGKESLEEISWDDFFEKFEEKELALVIDNDPKSRFCKLVSRRNPRD